MVDVLSRNSWKQFERGTYMEESKMIPKSEWVWYGFACHFIGSRNCEYHLGTRIGNRLISTVGAYNPHEEESYVALGLDEDSFFETMIFECGGEDEHGNPIVPNWIELYVERYSESLNAERGHRALCERVAKGEI